MQKLQCFDICNQLPNHLLMKVDKATMQHSVEARVPFLDHDLVSFALSLKSKDKVNYESLDIMPDTKIILKEVMKPYLPEAILKRKKFGMMLPIDQFVEAHKNNIREYINDTSPFSKIESLYFLQKNLKNDSFFKNQQSWQMWRILIVGAWLNYFSYLRT